MTKNKLIGMINLNNIISWLATEKGFQIIKLDNEEFLMNIENFNIISVTRENNYLYIWEKGNN